MVTALAPEFAVFLVGRAVQGVSFGLVPITIVLARRHLPAAMAPSAISTLSVTVSVGLGIGYPLTGLLCELAGFRISFWVAAAFSVAAMIAIRLGIPADRVDERGTGRLDVVGALLLGAGLAAALLALGDGPGWMTWRSPLLAVVAVAVLAVWVWWELRAPHPLVNLRVLREADVRLAHGAAIGLGAAMYMGVSVVSLIAQAPESTGYGFGLGLIAAGFVMLPLSVGSLAANRISRIVARRHQLSTVLLLSTTVVFATAVYLVFVHTEFWQMLIGMLLFGVGIGGSFFAMPALIARSAAEHELGSAVSFNQVLRTVGGSGGSAIAGAMLAIVGTDAAGFPTMTWQVFAGAAAISGAVLLLLLIRAVRARGSHRPA